MKKVKEGKSAANQRFFNGNMKVREPAFVTGTAAEVSRNRSVTVRKLAQAYGVSTETIHATLHKDLNLSTMSVTWVTKLLSEEMKKEQVRTCKTFLAMDTATPWQRLKSCLYGQVCGVLSHPTNQAIELAVAGKG